MRAAVRPLSGLDLVELGRFRRALDRHPRLRDRLFTPAELEYCRGRADALPGLAARFAAKEAVAKLLGCGVISWQEIEVVPGSPPRVLLHGETARVAERALVGEISLSLTHTGSVSAAVAAAIAESGEGEAVGKKGTGAAFGWQSLADRPVALTPEQVRELDRATIEDVGVPGPVLMERAALGISSLIRERFPGLHTLIVCGRGNNGGDGLAAARQLHLAGHPVACVVAANRAPELSTDAQINLRAAQGAGVNLRLGGAPDYLWDESEVVVDCLLGTGTKGEIRDPLVEYARLINRAGARGVPIVAVDIPSGVDAASGAIAGETVAADVTVTFHVAKSGLVCPPGSEAAGELLVWDIGLPRFLESEPDVRVVTPADAAVPGRRPDDHKYRAGFVAVVAGSGAYPGAAFLAASGAARSGAGYVRLITPSAAARSLRGRLVEVLVQEAGGEEQFDEPASVLVALADQRIGAVVVGPGVGRTPETAGLIRKVVLEAGPPSVLDADGLLAFAGRPEELARARELILTPHAGELAALLGEDVKEVGRSALLAARRGASLTGQVLLLKGSSTVIAAPGGETWAVTQAPPQLATAGTGDVLSGCLGAMLARGLAPLEAAKTGAWIHAQAGWLAAARLQEGLLAGDLLELLPYVVSERIQKRRPGWRS